MLTVDDYATIRLAHRDGMSIRQIARTFGHSRRKVRQVLAQAQPKPYNGRGGRTVRRRAGDEKEVPGGQEGSSFPS